MDPSATAYAWQPDDPRLRWQDDALPADVPRLRQFLDDGALRRCAVIACGERLVLPALAAAAGTSLRLKLAALDPAASAQSVRLRLRRGERCATLLEIPGQALSLQRCLTAEVSLQAEAEAAPLQVEVEVVPSPDAAASAPPVAAVALCELLVGRPEEMARLAGRSHYGWRSDNERGHFTAVYRDVFYAPEAGAEPAPAPRGAAPAVVDGSAVADPALRAALLQSLARLEPLPGEDAFGFAQRLLAESLQRPAPDFFARAAALAQRPPGSLPLRVLSILCGSARVELQLLERCAAPVEMILFDFNADLLAEAAARMPPRHRVIALNGDINDGLPAVGAVDVVMCVSALHHVVELERVLADAARLLGEDGEFWSVGEYVGRNGSRLGPDEYARADALFRSFPERIRQHRILQQVDGRLPNVDCSSSSFEGVRAEDVLELLHRCFEPEQEHLRNCLLWRLTDPAYGPNFDVADPADVDLLRQCVAEDVLCWLQGGRATELNGIYRKRRLRDVPVGPPTPLRLVDFTCNVCGELCRVPLARLSREAASCAHCHSTVRMRAMVHLLSVGLFGDSRALVDFPEDRSIRGVGLSDWPGYAEPLAERLGYRNTYYHQRPRLDITQPAADLLGTLDFVVATDVFEHVSPPVERAFAGAAALLKPGGVLVFSVPYGFDAATVEHYPELHDFEVHKEGDRYLLVNRTRDGRVQSFPDPVFHGGPGQTLELRLFCLDDIRRHAAAAGFEVEVLEDPVWRFGIHDPHPWSRPMLLRKLRGG